MGIAPAVTPETLTTRLYEKLGYLVDGVERLSRKGGKTWKNDLFGIGDLVAVGKGRIILLQATSIDHYGDHKVKIFKSSKTPKLVANGMEIELVAWGDPEYGIRRVRMMQIRKEGIVRTGDFLRLHDWPDYGVVAWEVLPGQMFPVEMLRCKE